jgi:hypothetical protein
MELGNSLLTPLAGIPRRSSVSNVESRKIVVQGHVPRHVAATVTGPRNWRRGAH